MKYILELAAMCAALYTTVALVNWFVALMERIPS